MRADMKTDYKGADVQGAGHRHTFSLMFSLNQRDNFTYFFPKCAVPQRHTTLEFFAAERRYYK